MSDGGAAEPGARLSAMLRSVSDGVHGAVQGDSSSDMSGLQRPATRASLLQGCLRRPWLVLIMRNGNAPAQSGNALQAGTGLM